MRETKRVRELIMSTFPHFTMSENCPAVEKLHHQDKGPIQMARTLMIALHPSRASLSLRQVRIRQWAPGSTWEEDGSRVGRGRDSMEELGSQPERGRTHTDPTDDVSMRASVEHHCDVEIFPRGGLAS